MILLNQQQLYGQTEFESASEETQFADLFSENNTPFSDMDIEGATVIFGDIDNDGDLDLFLSGAWVTDDSSIEYISRTYVNDGNGNFSEKENSNLEGAGRGDAAFGDIDNDGDLDLIITGATFGIDGKLAKTYINDGDGNFTEKSNSLTGVQYGSIALGDIDNDGDLDLIISGQANPHNFNDLSVYLNDGSGSFTSTPDDFPSVNEGAVIFGDIDNDGDLDLFITGHDDFDGRISSTYINDGAGNFSEKNNPITALERSSAAFGDIDNDGDLDLIVSGNQSGNDPLTQVYTNDGNGNFSATSQPFTNVMMGTVAFGDLDSDGDLDVINTGFSDDGIITERFMNDGNGNFAEDAGSLMNLAANSIAMGDIDQDGALDLIIAGNYTNNDETVKFYTNLSENINSVPSAPGSLSAVQNGSEITLSWGTASDNETPADGLSYNIFVKENPEGDPPYLISPMALENTGWRKLPAFGNRGQQKSYTLQTPELACGESTDYTFRVQAIDHNFEGGAFSDEYEFSVQPPEIAYVDQDATSGDNNGSSWENAYTDLHTALNNLGVCITEVWVAEGTYIPAAETTPFRLTENLSLLGGFEGTEADPSERNISDNPTILSGDVNGSESADAGDAHIIVLIPGVTNGVTIDGFIFESGYADGGGTGDRTGAAIDNNGNNTISNTIFRDNHAVGNGSNGVGGAVISFGGELTFVNTLFYNNSSTGSGGAISAENGTVRLINSTLANNEGVKGGAINFWAGNVLAINSIFYNNSGTNGNMNDDGGSGTGIAEHSLFFNETSSNSGDLPPNINNVGGNLLNTNPEFTDEENGDYSLLNTSLALNAGSNDPFGTGEPAEGITTDLAGNDRFYNSGTVDMGAYELQGEPFFLSPDDDNIFYVNKSVDTEASGYDGSGDSWGNAIPELADALRWAREQHDDGSPGWDSDDHLQIWVAEGTYKPLYNAADGSYTEDGGRDNAFVMLPNVELYGGFDPGNGITDLSDDRIFPTTNPGEGTILSADLDDNDNPDDFDNHNENTYHVVLVPEIVDSGLLDGITLQGGNGNGSSTISIFGILFSRHTGGGLFSRGAITVRNGRIMQNRVEDRGGGVNSYGNLTLRDVVVGENHSSGTGGGISSYDSADLVNVLVAGNTARRGAGIYLSTSGSPTLTNTTITGNAADTDGGGLSLTSAPDLGPSIEIEAVNSIVWGNTASTGADVWLSGLSITFTAGNSIVGGGEGGGLDNDPLFTDPDNGDYSLLNISPAINTGDNDALPSGVTTDLAGNDRIFDGTPEPDVVDMGAYEFQGDLLTIPDQVVLSTPADEATNVELTPEFSWQSVDGADEYEFQVSENDDLSDPVINESGLTATTFEPASDLTNATTYNWRTRASNEAGDGDWSEVFSFSTLPESSEVVILTDPTNEAEDVSLQPLFEWNAADGAESYDLVVSVNSDFSDPVIDENEISEIEFQTADNLDFSTLYYWQVRGVNSGGPGEWSEAFSFTTLGQPEAADNRILLANSSADGYTFTPADFGTTDNSFTVIIDDLPGGFNGQLQLGGSGVNTNDEISVGDIDTGDLVYTPVPDSYGYGFDSFTFSIEDASGNPSEASYTMGLDLAATSIELTGSERTNGEGWRFLGNPSDGDSYDDLLGPIWTKGMAGSDSPGATFSNVNVINQQDYQWDIPGDLANPTEVGQPFIVYVYADDDNDGVPEGFPKILTSGQNWLPLNGDFSFDDLDYGESPSNPDNFYLLANPHPIELDFCEFAGTNIATAATFWNPDANGGNGDYQALNCATLDELPIAPFQAFWIRTTDTNPALGIPTSAYLGTAAAGYFKEPQVKEDLFRIVLNVESEDQQKPFYNRTELYFSEDASADLDEMDAVKLSPEGLANRWLSFYSMDQHGKAYAFQSVPMDFEEKVSVPLDIQTTESSQFTLDWTLPESHIFNGSYFLRDNQTGEVIELREGNSYSFDIDPSQAVKVSGKERSTKSPKDFADLEGAAPRFELLIAATGIDGFTELGAVPEAFELEQNYPNPFNPTTVISYQLPVSSEVRLDVYDMLGRNVATLVNGRVSAGSHTVNFDAGNLSSGVYLYRLQAGSQIMTRKLTVVK